MVAEAADGEEAVALFEAHRPDVVLIDLRMPRLDGVGAIQAIRALDPGARLVALTTYEGDADIHRALSAGACGYLLKDALVDAVRAAAAGKESVFQKLGARDRTHAVTLALQRGIVHLDE